MSEERRQHKRMFFSKKDGPVAIFSPPDREDEIVTAIVMDLSTGGFGLSIRKEEYRVTIGDRLILTDLKGLAGLQFIVNIETEVKWLQDYKNFDHILFGCEFMNVSESFRKGIGEFINSWINR